MNSRTPPANARGAHEIGGDETSTSTATVAQTSLPYLYSKADAQRLFRRTVDLCARYTTTHNELLDKIGQCREWGWRIAGYKSWPECVTAEFRGVFTGLPTEDRRQWTALLASQGLGSRAIAPIVGVSDRQVRTDIAAAPAQVGSNFPPDDDTDPGEDPGDDNVVPSRRVTGRDGKRYTAPATAPKPRRNPLPPRYQRGLWEVDKALRRVQRLHAEPNFAANREGLRVAYTGWLDNYTRIIEQLRADLSGSEAE